MAATYSISALSPVVTDGITGQTITVSYTVTRSGDTTTASSVSWSTVADPLVPASVESDFFTAGVLPSGVLNFAAGQTSQAITVNVKGGIDTLPNGHDWGSFDLGIQLNVPTQSTTGFDQSASGGYGVTTNDYIVNGSGGTLDFSYNMYTIPDQADIYRNGVLILSTNRPVSDTGDLVFSGNANGQLTVGDDIKVVITGSIQGTVWDYNLNYNPGISSVIEAHTIVDTKAPSVLELARLSNDVYLGGTSSINGYRLLSVAAVDPTYAGFGATAYSNENGTQIVVAFRGTVPTASKSGLKNALADTSFPTGIADSNLDREIQDAVNFLNEVTAAYAGSGVTVTLTGHSLGGAIAQIVGKAGAYATYAFDAPGGNAVYGQLTSILQGLTPGGASSVSNNYRLRGDQVSLAGSPIGSVYTVTSPNPDSLLSASANHMLTTLITQLAANPSATPGGINVVTGIPDSTSNYLPALQTAFQGFLYATAPGRNILTFTLATSALVNNLMDPTLGTDYVFIGNPGSPTVHSIALPTSSGVAKYSVDVLLNNQWGGTQYLTPEATLVFGAGVTAFKFVPMDASGNAVQMPASFHYQESFNTSGQVSASLIAENGDVSNNKDFNADGTSEVLLSNTNGSVIDWLMQNGSYAGYDAIGPSNGYRILGTGDFNSDGTTDVLLQNGSGSMIDWTMSNGGYAAYKGIGNANSSGYGVVGTGDYNADGATDILLENGQGNVIDWTMKNGTYSGYQQIGNTTGYGIVRNGDFNGDGTTDVLLQNGGGNLIDWTMQGGSYLGWNEIGNPAGAGYGVVGVGDFNRDGTADVLLENGSGNIIDWILQDGHYTGWNEIGNVSGYGVVGTGDYNGDGTSDVLLENSTGNVIDWIMKNGVFSGWNEVGNSVGFSVKA